MLLRSLTNHLTKAGILHCLRAFAGHASCLAKEEAQPTMPKMKPTHALLPPIFPAKTKPSIMLVPISNLQNTSPLTGLRATFRVKSIICNGTVVIQST